MNDNHRDGKPTAAVLRPSPISSLRASPPVFFAGKQMERRDDIFEIRRKHRANIPDLHNGAYRRNWDKAMTGKSLRAAVKAKCLDCMCWQLTEVYQCSCVACPLYPYRPAPQKARSTRQNTRHERSGKIDGQRGTSAGVSTVSGPEAPLEATF